MSLPTFYLARTRTHTHTSIGNAIRLWFLNLWMINIFSFTVLLNFINRCYIFQYERYSIKWWDFNKEIPIGGLLLLTPTQPLHCAALLLRLLCLQSPVINIWCLIHIFDKWDWCIHHQKPFSYLSLIPVYSTFKTQVKFVIVCKTFASFISTW